MIFIDAAHGVADNECETRPTDLSHARAAELLRRHCRCSANTCLVRVVATATLEGWVDEFDIEMWWRAAVRKRRLR